VTEVRELVHGTCVAFGRRGALLRGSPGSGKSDLALRFLALTPEGGARPLLVADDQVWIAAGAEGALLASPPATLAGKIEVRGFGIVEVPFLAEAELLLVCDLVNARDVPRMPPQPLEQTEIAGCGVRLLKLAPFEASAALKLKLALYQPALVNPK
jgi:HPr kinase/phosphorylase